MPVLIINTYPRWTVRICRWIPEEVLRTFSQFFHKHLNITFMEFYRDTNSAQKYNKCLLDYWMDTNTLILIKNTFSIIKIGYVASAYYWFDKIKRCIDISERNRQNHNQENWIYVIWLAKDHLHGTLQIKNLISQKKKSCPHYTFYIRTHQSMGKRYSYFPLIQSGWQYACQMLKNNLFSPIKYTKLRIHAILRL